MRPRWKRCLRFTDDAVGEILGQAYVRKNFTPEAKARALEMVRNIRAELHSRLGQLTWMSAQTKTKAYTKLDSIINKIGYPDSWRDYTKLEARPGPFVSNLLLANEFEARRQLNKIGRPTDRKEWGMTPPTVNAYYNPPTNEITFPAGIMQPPFFNPKADDAVNYGGMGGAIGHEITHGFDDEGRQFDAQGNLSGWWTEADTKEFNRRAEVVQRQFDSYVAIDSLHVNGKLTLGENIADFGGLLIAHGAYRRSLQGKPDPAPIDGLTGDQRFFLAWAQIWRAKTRPEYARLLVNVDPHAPPEFRTIGPLSNIPAFAQAFGCKAGDPMVRPESERAQIW
jgi:putative endopeptidase